MGQAEYRYKVDGIQTMLLFRQKQSLYQLYHNYLGTALIYPVYV